MRGVRSRAPLRLGFAGGGTDLSPFCDVYGVFARQVHGLARAGDVLIAMSTSGRSPNVLRALEAGRAIGCTNVGFGGRQSAMASFCDIYLEVPSSSPPLIQQAYMMAAHAICGEIERALFAKGEVESERA